MSRVALAQGHAREYETIYILRPNIEKQAAGDVATRVVDAIKGTEGVLTQAELWGQRRLAFPVARHHRGTYVYVKYLGTGPTVAEIERQLRLVDSVIRFQTVQLRNNVPMENVEVPAEDLEIDFDIPFEPDEPEVPRERELGLDGAGDRRRRDDRDRGRDRDQGSDDDDESSEKSAKSSEKSDKAEGSEGSAESKESKESSDE